MDFSNPSAIASTASAGCPPGALTARRYLGASRAPPSPPTPHPSALTAGCSLVRARSISAAVSTGIVLGRLSAPAGFRGGRRDVRRRQTDRHGDHGWRARGERPPCESLRKPSPPYIAEAPRVQTDGSQINSAAGPTARST